MYTHYISHASWMSLEHLHTEVVVVPFCQVAVAVGSGVPGPSSVVSWVVLHPRNGKWVTM